MEVVRRSLGKTALDEACEDARHYHRMWQAAERRAARLQAAWEALERVLPLCDEWPRGTVLASDGRLLTWVLANDPGEEEG